MLIIGCGYVGRRMADRLVAEGRPAAALTRSPRRADELREAGIAAVVGDVTRPETLSPLHSDDGAVLVAVGYDRDAAPSLREVYVDGLRNVLDALARGSGLRRLIYLSSTGVYGPNGGELVDESSPCEPLREGGKACLAAERLLAEHPLTADAHVVLRLAGIYGPGRVPRLADLLAGRPVRAPENTWLNLIHVHDVVQVVAAAEQAPLPSRYCVSDGHPIRRHDYYRLIAELAGAPPPQLTPAAADSPAAARAAADKRVDNRKLLAELPVRLRHPDCRSGLRDILSQRNST